jgi:hypothetical protein
VQGLTEDSLLLSPSQLMKRLRASERYAVSGLEPTTAPITLPAASKAFNASPFAYTSIAEADAADSHSDRKLGWTQDTCAAAGSEALIQRYTEPGELLQAAARAWWSSGRCQCRGTTLIKRVCRPGNDVWCCAPQPIDSEAADAGSAGAAGSKTAGT